ncbi:hypothetical protein JD969_16495 [Planctomycetota bacterium]|nr:hypothetical protein JD969_16495 [Planctomycetota bacterium]
MMFVAKDPKFTVRSKWLDIEILCCGIFLTLALVGGKARAGITEKAIDQDIEARQLQILKRQSRNPYPKSGFWHYENLATGTYWLNENNHKADAALLDAQEKYYLKEKDEFHWHAYLLERIYFLYSSQSEYFPGRMSDAAEKAVLEMLWDWSSENCNRQLASLDRVWWVWGSENHHLQAWVSFWGAAQIFKNHPDYKNKKYSDGSTPSQLAKAFDRYFKKFLSERAMEGLLVEVASPTYAKYSLNTLYNIADFADDPVLKERASMFLDLYWADWSIEQINSIRGGSRHRCYPGNSSNVEAPNRGQSWLLFGIGIKSPHPGDICAATTFWRPSPVVVALATDWNGRGKYAYVTKRPGLDARNASKSKQFKIGARKAFGTYNLDPNGGSIRRYSWCTPDFVMGMTMVAPIPWERWSRISSQNRWNGIIFSGSDTARIFTRRFKPEKGSVYNAEWGVQNKGVMILQRLRDAKSATGQRIWFSKSLKRVKVDGWVFVEAPNAYAAVRIVNGTGRWNVDLSAEHHEGRGKTDLGEWLDLDDPFSPIVFEVASKENFSGFKAFQENILSNVLTLKGARCDYESLFYKTKLSLFTNAKHTPLVDGSPVNFTPRKTYDSPFIQQEEKITIKYLDMEEVYDFENSK